MCTTPEERLLAILAARQERDEKPGRETGTDEQECQIDESNARFTQEVVPTIVAVQAWADQIIRRHGYSLVQVHNPTQSGATTGMPNIAFLINGPVRALSTLSEVQPAGPPVIHFGLKPEGEILVSIAGLPHAVFGIDNLGREAAIAEFERFIRFAILDQ